MTRIKPYTPRGKVVALLEQMAADPSRLFNLAEAGEAMGVNKRGVMAMVANAMAAGAIHRGEREGLTVLSGQPFHGSEPPAKPRRLTKVSAPRDWLTPEDHPRVPRVVEGWTPPRMVCVRTGV